MLVRSAAVFRDIISLKDIDPHLMLVVFLPALLFESACFGIDMGIFLKQLPQIISTRAHATAERRSERCRTAAVTKRASPRVPACHQSWPSRQ